MSKRRYHLNDLCVSSNNTLVCSLTLGSYSSFSKRNYFNRSRLWYCNKDYMEIVSSFETNNKTRVMWFRQSITYSVDASEETEWERYSDFENEFIEEAFQRKDSEVNFNGCTINFHCSQQRYIDRKCVKVSIKRDEIHLSACMRKERFCYPHKLVTLFDSKIKQENTFFFKWVSKNRDIKRNFPAIANLAAQGYSIYFFSRCFIS